MNPLDGIVQFNKDRNLSEFDAMSEYDMILSELDELILATTNRNEHEQVDAFADVVVFAIGAIHKMGYEPTAVLLETLKEINSREGEIDHRSGKWEKDRNQDPSTLYKAVYTKA